MAASPPGARRTIAANPPGARRTIGQSSWGTTDDGGQSSSGTTDDGGQSSWGTADDGGQSSSGTTDDSGQSSWSTTDDGGQSSWNTTGSGQAPRSTADENGPSFARLSRDAIFGRNGWLASQRLRSDFHYFGPAEGALDRMVIDFGLSGWEYRDGRIRLLVTETMHFAFDILFNRHTQGIWEEVEEGIRRVCGLCAVLRTGSLTGFEVTALPDSAPRIRSYLEERNAYLSTLIQVEFDLYEVIWDTSDGFSLDLDVVFKNSRINLAFGGASPVLSPDSGQLAFDSGAGFESSEPGNLSANVNLSRSRGGGSFVFLKPDSRYSGSGAVFEALSKASNRVKAQSRAFVIPNNRIMEFKVSDISQLVVSTSRSDLHHEAGTTVTHEENIQEFDTGTTLQLHPMLTSDGVILLGYEVTINELLYPTLGGIVQDASNIRSHRREHVVSGELRVPSGVRIVFNDTTDTTAGLSEEGVGKSSFVLLGGERSSDARRSTTLITLRPTLVQTQRLTPEPATEAVGGRESAPIQDY